MSEVKLNLIDSQEILHGIIHGSMADAAVAALSAEPETIAELQSALARYVKPREAGSPFASFCSTKFSLPSDGVGINLPASSLDLQPWDAGIVVIDLAARIVAAESTYSLPRASGEVQYHDGTQLTDVVVPYRVLDDWLFVSSLAEYKYSRERRRMERTAQPALDVRTVLYGHALLEFIVNALAPLTETGIVIPGWQAGTAHNSAHNSDSTAFPLPNGGEGTSTDDNWLLDGDAAEEALAKEISTIHSRWLMTPREDLRGQSPREVLLARRDFIDFDLHTRELQWTFQGEGPPCLAHDSYAYRLAGFGTHEWVVYYDLMRHLLGSALENVRQTSVCRDRWAMEKVNFVGHSNELIGIDSEIARLEEIKTNWLEQPQRDYDGRIPAIIIENERKRLPLTLGARDMIIDEDCDLCRMSANEVAMGFGPGFWHLDGSHMDDEFAFSSFRAREEWEAERREWEEFNEKFNREWEERQQRIARGNPVDDEFILDWVDSLTPDRSSSDSFDDEPDESNNLIQ
jgi:hypothetical protein